MADHVQSIICGVDVAKDTLDIAQSDRPLVRIANTGEAITEWLDSLPGPARIAIEATGCYHELLQALAEAAGHEVYLISGKQLKHYREAVGQRAKTDADDACLLLRYLTREQGELEPVKVLNLQEKRLWRLLQRRATLVKTRNQLKLSLRGDAELRMTADNLNASLNQAIARVERIMKRLARKLGWEAAIERCQTIPGIGPLNALALVACFHRGEFKRCDQWIAYLGLDVRVRDSGTFRGRGKLTKRGNPEVRRLLFNGAKSAARMPAIRARYNRYRANGMSTTGAYVAMSRKLARIAFAVLSKGEVYDEKMPGWACVNP